MKALLDTHAIIFLAASPERLGPAARALIQDPAAQLHASLASLWEMGIKSRLGKLELPVALEAFWATTLERGRISELGIDKRAILKTLDLDMSHRDPFDRLLAAQALTAGYAFISNDAAVDVWGVKRISVRGLILRSDVEPRRMEELMRRTGSRSWKGLKVLKTRSFAAGAIALTAFAFTFAVLAGASCAGTPKGGSEPDATTKASTVAQARESVTGSIEPVNDGKRSLVVYYTSGNAAEQVATDLAALFSADVELIEESKPQRWSFFTGGAAAIFGTKVNIKPSKFDPAEYDRVFVLSPVWAWRLSPPVSTWLKAQAGRLPEAGFGTISGDTQPEKIVATMAKLSKRKPFAYAGFSQSDFLSENRATYLKKLRLLAGIDKR